MWTSTLFVSDQDLSDMVLFLVPLYYSEGQFIIEHQAPSNLSVLRQMAGEVKRLFFNIGVLSSIVIQRQQHMSMRK